MNEQQDDPSSPSLSAGVTAQLKRNINEEINVSSCTEAAPTPSPHTHNSNSNGRLLVLSLLVGAFVLVGTGLLSSKDETRMSNEFRSRLRTFDVNVPESRLPCTYVQRSASEPSCVVATAVGEERFADTTAIILNWSRLQNVLLLSSLLCGPWLDDTIAEVFIWNNNPNVTLTADTFKKTGCSAKKIRIHNSPSNVLFQARYLACSAARTPYCFMQDDDYLVQPEVIRNVRSFIQPRYKNTSVHLLPAHEHILSRLRTFTIGDGRFTPTFAWLGHGTYLTRASAIDFLRQLHDLNATGEEVKMADNYFSILGNRQEEAQIWFDHGIELGGGQPFTVGIEGDDRNDRHVARALVYFTSTSSSQTPLSDNAYIPHVNISGRVNFASCRLSSCVVMSNIELPLGTSHAEFEGSDLASIKRRKLLNVNAEERDWYIQHPLSSVVDARSHTAFRSFGAMKAGEWIILDALGMMNARDQMLDLVLLLTEDNARILQKNCSFSTSVDGSEWTDVENALTCVSVSNVDGQVGDPQIGIKECSVGIQRNARYFRVLLVGLDKGERRWGLHEMWLRYRLSRDIVRN